jgi:hypothetical protein
MHIRNFFLIGTTAFLATTGCASKEEWQTWKEHPSHFASGEHMTFSIRNREGSTAHVTRQDIAVSRDEGWWGKPITVSTEQILER